METIAKYKQPLYVCAFVYIHIGTGIRVIVILYTMTFKMNDFKKIYANMFGGMINILILIF